MAQYQNLANSCTFMGRIVGDPQFSTVQGSNGPFTKVFFKLAVDRKLPSQQRKAAMNGDTSIVTSDFVPCSAIGSNADFIKNYCPKGRAVIISACFTTYTYNDKNTGEKKYGYQFDVQHVEGTVKDAKNMVAPNQQNNGYQQQQGGYQQQGNGYQQNYQQQNNGYQQQNNGGFNNQSMNPPQQQQQQMQSNFDMFDENNSPF